MVQNSWTEQHRAYMINILIFLIKKTVMETTNNPFPVKTRTHYKHKHTLQRIAGIVVWFELLFIPSLPSLLLWPLK